VCASASCPAQNGCERAPATKWGGRPTTWAMKNSTASPRRPSPTSRANVDRSPEAARQLASRARRRVHGENTVPDADLDTQRRVVDAFLAAARDGDFGALLEVLDPDVVLRADLGPAGGSRVVRGAAAVADNALAYAGIGLHMRPLLINGAVGVVSFLEGQPFSIGGVTVRGGKIVETDILADPERLRHST
jgi:hypothetical protein